MIARGRVSARIISETRPRVLCVFCGCFFVIFVTLANRPDLNGKYAVFGRIVSGADVPAKLERGDVITRMYLKE